MALLSRVNQNDQLDSDRLIEHLLHEWTRPDQDADAEPIIIEEAPKKYARPNHIYVIWSEWQTLSGLERTRLILQAYTKKMGSDFASDVTLALGLTPAEAEKIGLKA